jgi:hypothetical protein
MWTLAARLWTVPPHPVWIEVTFTIFRPIYARRVEVLTLVAVASVRALVARLGTIRPHPVSVGVTFTVCRPICARGVEVLAFATGTMRALVA